MRDSKISNPPHIIGGQLHNSMVFSGFGHCLFFIRICFLSLSKIISGKRNHFVNNPTKEMVIMGALTNPLILGPFLLGLIGILFGFGLQFIDERPPAMMIFSQAFQALILPAVAIPIFILINRSQLMQNRTPGKRMNVGIVAVILFGLLTSYFAIAELL